MNITFEVINTSFGSAAIAVEDNLLVGIGLGQYLDNAVDDLKRRFPDSKFTSCNVDQSILKSISNVLNGEIQNADIPIQLNGTEFQISVWNAIISIERGKTSSYKEIAEKIGKPKAYRAVGSACNLNPAPIVIPCHRVVGSGTFDAPRYRYGADMKLMLLRREGIFY